MATKKPTTKPKARTVVKKESVKASDWLSFSSAIIALVASGIFYFAGWVYISHWYSFFGIDASQLNISLQLVLLHGIPGILVIVITGLLSLTIFAISKYAAFGTQVTVEDASSIVFTAYTSSVAILIVMLLGAIGFNADVFHAPIEVLISIGAVAILSGVIYLIGKMNEAAIQIPIGEGIIVEIHPARTVAKFRMMFLFLVTFNFRGILSLVFENWKIFKNEHIKIELAKEEEEILAILRHRQSRLKEAASNTSTFWLGAILLLYFLVSISASAIFGEGDAIAGRKSMIGGWQAEETYIYSIKDNLPLPLDMTKSVHNSYAYGPLMIIGKSEDNYYLTDWIYNFPYTKKPNVYVVKLTENTSLGVKIFAPTPTPTMTPFIIFTSTPRPTQTPNPIFTITPTP